MNEFLILYMPPVAAMLVIAVIAHKRLMDSPAYRGWWGEYRVNLMLRLCLSNDYKILANSIYRGQRKGESTQVDHIVVSRYGIFVIETKTLKGVIKVDSEQPSKWVQIVGRRRYLMDNPLKQNYAHLKAIQHVTGVHAQKIFSYVAMAGTATFEGEAPERVYSIWRLVKKIQSNKTPVLTSGGANSVYRRLVVHKIKGGYWAARRHTARLRSKSGREEQVTEGNP
ncbi:nuclease-related domain-containing protein [Pseudomonas neustonica]|uniref:nuclease-related domain-containing protein n=1 Tax=Pseudomonas neustonica TaxID=2487346 RepID=UPI003F4567E5|tara:strand:- start:14947 stop:15621 length:675 start_codon:yes stop_codon:yes gene_type:complete